MSTGKTTSVTELLAALPPDRKAAIEAVRKTIRKNLRPGFEEGVAYGMLAYWVPLSRFPDTHNGQPLALAAVGSNKGYMTLHLMNVYGDRALEAWFKDAWAKSGKKLDMGKACVRFKKLDDLALDVVGEAFARTEVDAFVEAAKALYSPAARAARREAGAKKAAPKKPAAKKAAPKKAAAKKSVAKPKRTKAAR